MKNAIILHGCPEKEYYYKPDLPSESNAHWLPWLQKELIIRDIAAVTPEVPHAYEPDWNTWVREVERFDITSETILVGHSAGAGFWLKYLCVRPELRVGKVVLVGPWLDPKNTVNEEFFDFTIDPDVTKRTTGIIIFYANDDSDSVHVSLKKVRTEIKGVKLRRFKEGYGHFTYHNLGSEKFPELLEEILTKKLK